MPRRAFLGAELAPDTEAFSERGVLVAGVVAGGMAFVAGVQAGDRLVSLNALPLRSLCELGVALREAGKEGEVLLVVERAGQSFSQLVPVQPCPCEVLPGQEIVYDHVQVAGARLRRIVTRPLEGRARGLIVLLQGIACESIDYGPASQEPMARLLSGWASAGFVTVRVDKRGVGDSEGGPCGSGDFETEVADHRAALDALLGDSRCMGLDLYLFGHSIGGMVAPILATERAVQGVMVYGSSTRTWLDCVFASTRRQYQLRGLEAVVIDEILGSLRERIDREGLNGRCAAYHHQLNALDLPAIWRGVSQTPVLILCGENDWVLSHEEQLEIASHVDAAEAVDLPGLDHMLGWHSDRASSLSLYGQGAFDPAILELTLEWLSRNGVPSQP